MCNKQSILELYFLSCSLANQIMCNKQSTLELYFLSCSLANQIMCNKQSALELYFLSYLSPGEMMEKLGALEICENLLRISPDPHTDIQLLRLVNNLSCNSWVVNKISETNLPSVVLGMYYLQSMHSFTLKSKM